MVAALVVERTHPGSTPLGSTGCRTGGLFSVFVSRRSWTSRVAPQWDYDVPVVYKALCGFGGVHVWCECVVLSSNTSSKSSPSQAIGITEDF